MFDRPCIGSTQRVCVATLREGTNKAKAKIQSESHGNRAWYLLEELYAVRAQQERYLRGEAGMLTPFCFDGST
jgi:hypothetical protein